MIQKKVNKRIQRDKMTEWYTKMQWSKRLSKFMNILQIENDSRMAHQFFPNLATQTFTN